LPLLVLVLYFKKDFFRLSFLLSDRLKSSFLKSLILVIYSWFFIPVILLIDFGILKNIFLIIFNIKDFYFSLFNTGIRYKFSIIGISGIIFFIDYLKSRLKFFRTFNDFNFKLSILINLVLAVDLLDEFFLLALILFFWKNLY